MQGVSLENPNGKSLNNNVQDQFFCACKNEHPQQTIVLTKAAGQQPGSGHCYLRSSIPEALRRSYVRFQPGTLLSFKSFLHPIRCNYHDYHAMIVMIDLFLVYSLHCYIVHVISLDSEGEKEALSNMKRVLDEQDAVMANQAQEIEERQNEIESLCTELQTWQEKCSFAEKELERKKTEISSLKEQTMTASEENKRLETLSEEVVKMKVRLSSYLRLRLVLFMPRPYSRMAIIHSGNLGPSFTRRWCCPPLTTFVVGSWNVVRLV